MTAVSEIDIEALVQRAVAGERVEHSEVVEQLVGIARALQNGFGAAGIAVTIESGYWVNWGRQWRIVVRIAAANLEQVLFKAYVPAEGYPVKLDFYGDRLESAGDRAELEDAVKRFIAQPEISSQLAEIKAIAA